MTLADEQLLLEKARADPAYFGPLYDAYYPKIFGYVFRRTADYDLARDITADTFLKRHPDNPPLKYYFLARDITADTFLKAVLKLPGFEWRGVSVAAWLFRIATNELRMYYRQRKYESTVFGQLPEQFVLERRLHLVFEQERKALEAQMKDYQDFVKVQKALQHLPLSCQEALSLRYFEQKTVLEIARILAKSEGTVKSLLFRGLEKLKRSVL